jgi:hypothetical protein
LESGYGRDFSKIRDLLSAFSQIWPNSETLQLHCFSEVENFPQEMRFSLKKIAILKPWFVKWAAELIG